MPRARKPGALEPRRRSRNGCWPCKGRKVKCGEEHPSCLNCQKLGDTCDYSIRLNWGGRRTKRSSQSLATLWDSPQQHPHTDPEPAPSLKRSHTFPATNNTYSSISPTLCGTTEQTGQQQQNQTRYNGEGPGATEDLDSRDGVGHVPRAFSTSCLVAKGTTPALPGLSSWSVFGGQFETFSMTTADTGQVHVPPVRHKRAKSLAEVSEVHSAWHSPIMSSPSSHNTGSPCPQLYMAQSGYASVSHGSPATPAAASAYSDDENWKMERVPGSATPMNTALRGSGSEWRHQHEAASLLLPPPMPPFHEAETDTAEAYCFYGFDVGARDLDIGKNNDDACVPYAGLPAWKSTDGVRLTMKDWGGSPAAHKGTDDYYETPVPILIPRHLEPLPEKLMGSRMNLLYFHHFINHTARVLVSYDDLRSNPFHTILPEIAVKDDTLMSLLLAYSASHRARILQQNEPEMRIATWVEDIFPTLRRILNDDDEPISDANLATSIMLASLEIISPSAFGFDIPWQRHLGTARSLMAKRLAMLSAASPPTEEISVCSFLWSWLAYLDVLGSLSGGASEEANPREDNGLPLPLTLSFPGFEQDPDEIDCILGFSMRCLSLLAQVARLILQCGEQHHHDGRLPDPSMVQLAERLDQEFRHSMARTAHPCQHVRAGPLDSSERSDMATINEAFHLAGLLHLHRRVLGKPPSHPDAEALTDRILQCLDRVRRGGTAETALLFPMFSAGCDVRDDGRRGRVLERFRGVEANGMTQARRARRLMEKAWVTGRSWETLMTTEFIG